MRKKALVCPTEMEKHGADLALACDGDGTVATRKKLAKATVQRSSVFASRGGN